MKGYRIKFEKGFTLIEVVVALAILGIGLAVLLEAFSGGLRLERTSLEYTKAMDFGRIKMEEIAVKPSVEEGTEEGNFNDTFHWQTDVKKVLLLQKQKNDPNFKPPAQLYKIQLLITWKSGAKERSSQIESYKSVKPGTDEKKI